LSAARGRRRPRTGGAPVARLGSMRVVRSVAALRRALAPWRRQGGRIAFVPTMGALHAGHLSLVRRARAGSRHLVASIFVNPLQFGPREDYARYPRPIARDRALLRAAGVDLLWLPQVADLYPPGERTRVRVEGLDQVLEGASRPGHFTGVTTVVAKLLGAVQPDVLWLGQKDAQQAMLIERMVHDLLLPVRVRRGPTQREPDGLALSSRNLYLNATERAQAVALSRGLAAARRALVRGERGAVRLERAIRRELARYPRVREDYVAIVDARSLAPVRRVRGRVLVAIAARIGGTRLIDNFEWGPA